MENIIQKLQDFIDEKMRFFEPEEITFLNKLKEEMNDHFIVIEWPETQYLMGFEGFKENCHLINDEEGLNKYDSSAYMVNLKWINSIELSENILLLD